MKVIWLGLLILAATAVQAAQPQILVEYLCADWGPAMTLSAKKGDKPKFSATDEEVYFLKQVHVMMPQSPSQEARQTTSLYLCKMKSDGSCKTEIRELWHNVTYPIDTQGQTSWLDVNPNTKRIALAIGYAGTDLVGLWLVNLDGTELKRIVTERTEENQLRAVNRCSWTPDGQWIVFSEELRGTKPDNIHRIAKCNVDSQAIVRLTQGPWQDEPAVSPDGKTIVYGQVGDAKTGGIYLMDIDGGNPRLLPNPDDKRSNKHSGGYPAWSPDGKKIYAVSAGIVDVKSGMTLNNRRPDFDGRLWSAECVHWGPLGLLGSATSFRITLTDTNLLSVRALALSGIMDAHPAYNRTPDRE